MRLVKRRQPKFEKLEERTLLSASTDIVFLVDESGSSAGGRNPIHDWLEQNIATIDSSLRGQGIDDIRYGLIGFGGDVSDFGHSHLVDQDTIPLANNRLFSSGTATDQLSDVTSALLGLNSNGGAEDGWDALEHAIAEYEFREGAVPVLVLVQSDEGRIVANSTLTREGVFAALESKNALLNVIAPGDEVPSEPLFDLSPYGLPSNQWVLGVEADAADGQTDHQHDMHVLNTTTSTIVASPVATVADALQVSYEGSNTGPNGMIGMGKSVLIEQNPLWTDGIGDSDVQPGEFGYRAKSIPYVEAQILDLRNDPTANEKFSTFPGILPEKLTDAELGSFQFPFFGITYNELYLGDGSISTQNELSFNEDISQTPGFSTTPAISVLADDRLSIDSSIEPMLWKLADLDGDMSVELIVQWNFYDLGGNNRNDPLTVQAVLHQDGRIVLNYLDLSGLTLNYLVTGGVGATVGIWSGQAETINIPSSKFIPGLHSINGDLTVVNGDTSIAEMNDGYVRMAWDTGGAAWDAGIIDVFGAASTQANALRDVFVASLATQIQSRVAALDVAFADVVLEAINFGGGAIASEGFAADPVTPNAVNSHTVTSINDNPLSNSIPKIGPASVTASEVFKTARTVNRTDGIAQPLSITVNSIHGTGTLPDGTYAVELYFAELDPGNSSSRKFDVVLEDQIVLNDYNIADDRTLIQSGTPALGVAATGDLRGVVKRFSVDVKGGNGLQIDLVPSASTGIDPTISGVRVLTVPDTAPPRVANVTISGSASSHAPFSFNNPTNDAIDFDGSGIQLRTVPVGGANTITIEFDQPILSSSISASSLVVTGLRYGTVPVLASGGFTHVAGSTTAVWRFNAPFVADQYLLSLSDLISDMDNNQLDGEWTNPKFIYTVNSAVSRFPSGNGVAGGTFNFVFTILPGDASLDNLTTNSDYYNFFVPNYGLSGAGFTQADFSGNGIVDMGDAYILYMNMLRNLTGMALADFNYDGIVDAADYTIWGDHQGATVVPWTMGDATGDGLVNTADYQVWLRQFGLQVTTVM